MFSRFKYIIITLFFILSLFTGCKSKLLVSTGEKLLIDSFSPSADYTCEGNSIMVVSVESKLDSLTVTAYFNSTAVQLNKEYNNEQSDIYYYSGYFTLPTVSKKTDVGQIKFICSDGNTEEIYYSGMITVLPSAISSVSGSDVGNGLIAEITKLPAETFDGQTVDDSSKPYNSYLPVGTVDYCSSAAIVNSRIDKSYRLLRFGKRVYESNIKTYEGSLPDSNTLSVCETISDEKYTYLSFYYDWKAPFTFELKDQKYRNEKTNNWNVDSVDFSYVEIKFMYCDTLYGDITFEKDNPLFSHSDKFIQDDTMVLRLYLKKTGVFYGFKAEYSDDDCLVFKFLQPTVLYKAQNEYGYSLANKTIIIDAGHGGKDPGATANSGEYESFMNLSFAKNLKTELEKIGATVIMTRKDNSYVSANERVNIVLSNEPDFLISIHRNAGSSNGYSSYYFNTFSFDAAKILNRAMQKANPYRKYEEASWHYFFLNRIGICPSVLTENGFMTDKTDVENMKSADHQAVCTKATVKGIVDYFISQES